MRNGIEVSDSLSEPQSPRNRFEGTSVASSIRGIRAVSATQKTYIQR